MDFILGLITGASFIIVIACIFSIAKSSAMDVYQGKTTLEYKVVDGEKVDSVVVFKTYAR